MSINIVNRTGAGGGEDWWRDIDNAEANAALAAANMTNAAEIKGIDGAMKLFALANREMLHSLIERQSELQQTAGKLALSSEAVGGIYN